MRLQLKRSSLLDTIISVIEKHKTSERLILRALFFVTLALALLFAYTANKEYSFTTPTRGGVLIEGIVGIPRFINPALAITRADQDTVALVYSGLYKINSTGELVPDIAESITISEDGKVYHVTVRKDRTFHDGQPITAKDAIYTIELVQDEGLKSPLRGNWSDVTIEEINEYEFTVTLPEPYYPFIENFTLGIMPRHIWSTLPIEQLPFSQHNTEPVGSGPFSIQQVNRDASGLISGYSLVPAQSRPNLAGIELRFFQNETTLYEAFVNREINSTVYLPQNSIADLPRSDITVLTEPLPRIFGIFFNQNRSVALRDKAAREALGLAINKERIISEVLYGFGVPIDKPILTDLSTLESGSTEANASPAFSQEAAIEILSSGGWKKNSSGIWEKKIDQATETLSITIKTSNSEFFNQAVTRIAEDWIALGAEVQVEQYEQTDLVQSAIRTRDFQALLFGLDMNRTEDLYPFWHSSQKDDPGLNIAQYTNIAVDKLLEKTRNSQNKTDREQLLLEISNTISEEAPAVFLFSPSMTYVVDEEIVTTPMHQLGKPSDRFMDVSNWYAKTEVVWPIFQKENIVNDLN